MSINSMAQYNGGSPVSWTRHADYFLKENGYNTTGTSMATSAASGYNGIGGQGVTLISNRHVLMAHHVSALWGTVHVPPNPPPAQYPITVYFVNNDNIMFTYTIDSAANVATISGNHDISIGYLNTTVDASLSFYKVIPSDFLSYIQKGSIYAVGQFVSPFFPVLCMDASDQTDPPNQIPNPYIKNTWCSNLSYYPMDEIKLQFARPIAGPRFNNSDKPVEGDSGNIIFIPVNNELVILGAWWGPGSGVSPGDPAGYSSFIAPNITEINSAMTTLAGTSYSLTQADLSGFKTYA